MSEQDEPDPWPQKVPANHAITCFRVALWLLPSGFAVFSAWVGGWMIHHHYLPPLGVGSWLLANAIFVVGTGWYDALLSTKARAESDGVAYRAVMFFFLQLFLIPLLLLIIFFL